MSQHDPKIDATFCRYCYLDLDLQHDRSHLATAAAFVYATNARYGLSSNDLRALGGSERKRLPELLAADHDWSCSSSMVTRGRDQRLVVRLYWEVAPLACANFASLCANNAQTKLGTSGKPLTYQKSRIHRVIPGFVLQGGDFVFGNGSGGESIFGGKKFKDERAGLALKHSQRGVLSMGNSGKNSNTSQFFITLDKAPQCDGKHVIFGEVVSGWDVLEACEAMGSQPSGEPCGPIVITDCGIYEPLVTPGSGYWYDAPDPESYSGISPIFMVRPRVVVVAPSRAVLSKFTSAMGTFASVVGEIATDSFKEDDDNDNNNNVAACKKKISEHWLGGFVADVVLVAPSCKNVLSRVELPQSWQDRQIRVDEVILESKPVDALSTLWQKSWLVSPSRSDHWPLDGRHV